MSSHIVLVGRIYKPFEQFQTSDGKAWAKATISVFHSKGCYSMFDIHKQVFNDNSWKYCSGFQKEDTVEVSGKMFNYSVRNDQTNKSEYFRYVEINDMSKVMFAIPREEKAEGYGLPAGSSNSPMPPVKPPLEKRDLPPPKQSAPQVNIPTEAPQDDSIPF